MLILHAISHAENGSKSARLLLGTQFRLAFNRPPPLLNVTHVRFLIVLLSVSKSLR